MLTNKHAFIASIITLATGILVLSGYFSYKVNPETKGTTPIEQMPDTSYDEQRYRSFTDDELGLSFQYPAAWDNIEKEVSEPPSSMENARTEVILSVSGEPFMSIMTPGEPVPRGGWWGDIAAESVNQEAVRSFCDTYQTKDVYYIQPNEGCEILINRHQQTFARLKGSVEWFGTEVEDTYTYITFHDNHPFPSIALSAQSIREGDLEDELGNAEKAIQEIANSLSFTSQTSE